MLKKIPASWALAACLAFSGAAMAQAEGQQSDGGVSVPPSAPSTTAPGVYRPDNAGASFAVALRASVLQGLGGELIFGLNDYLNMRAQANYLGLNRSFKKDGVDYDARLKLRTIGALLDYHPFAGSFRLTAGVYNDGNHINGVATCRSGNQCQVGNATVTSTGSDDPSISAIINMEKGLAPYFGFGWGNAMKGSPLHFGFDVGVLLQGAPKTSMRASGKAEVSYNGAPSTTVNDLSSDPTFQAQLAKENADLNDSVSNYKIFPAISFTIGYRFNLQ